VPSLPPVSKAQSPAVPSTHLHHRNHRRTQPSSRRSSIRPRRRSEGPVHAHLTHRSCHRSLQSAPPAVTSECTTSELAPFRGLCGRWQAGWGGFRGGDPVRNRQPGCILLKAECNTDRPGRAQGGSTGCLWNSGRESKRFH
jgi:hypothetical protein